MNEHASTASAITDEVREALEWVDDFIARCNGDDRGSCESVNILRHALAAPTTQPTRQAVDPSQPAPDDEAMRAAFRDADARNPMRNLTPWQIWREACASRTPVPAAPSPWQPIETAPKDGTRFIGAHENRINFFHWQTGRSNGPEGWRDAFIYVYPEGSGPSHWMPLPSPPAAIASSTKAT